MTFLLTFIALSIVNVIFSTIRSITTIKSGKTIASLISGGYYAFYNIMLIYTVAEFPMWEKCVITFICNVIGVYVVKLVEEKLRKDRLWKIELTVPRESKDTLISGLAVAGISYNYIDINKYYIFNVYAKTQKESSMVKRFAEEYGAKYFATETKLL